MLKAFVAACATLATAMAAAQSTASTALKSFLNDPQLTHAVVGLHVTDANGQTLLANFPDAGLAPASSMKVLTAAAVLHSLGPTFQFATGIYHTGSISNGTLNGDVYLLGSGDPTLGSWRYSELGKTAFFDTVLQVLQRSGIKRISGNLVSSNRSFTYRPLPGGYIYDDMGNYYGAGTWSLNFHENQFDLRFDTRGPAGSPAILRSMEPQPGYDSVASQVTIGGLGDNSVIYAAPYGSTAYVTGHLERGHAAFTIGGSLPNGELSLLSATSDFLQNRGIAFSGSVITSHQPYNLVKRPPKLGEYLSPRLDSQVYWFLQKSINLYGEAFIKQLALVAKKPAGTTESTNALEAFWKENGIPAGALNLHDGSGLSPQNRVTAKALTHALQFASQQSWFKAFYEAMPTIHNYKMKSGTIGGAKAYAGYMKASSGREIRFALIVNNYTGSSSALVQKMWLLLDRMKASL